jgi:hypothetical protein
MSNGPNMDNDELDEMCHLWDGSEDWFLSAHYMDEIHLKVVFAGGAPSIQEIGALRKLLNEYRDRPLQQIKEQVGSVREFDLGIWPGFEAQPILNRAEGLGLNVIGTDKSHIGYLPVHIDDAGNQTGLIIDDEELDRRVTQKMLEAGVPIIHEADPEQVPTFDQ